MSRVLVQEYNSYIINEVAWYCGFEETTFIVFVADTSNLNYLNYAVLDEFRKFCDDAVVFLSYSVADCGVKPDGTEWYKIEVSYMTECAFDNAYRRRKIDLYG